MPPLVADPHDLEAVAAETLSLLDRMGEQARLALDALRDSDIDTVLHALETRDGLIRSLDPRLATLLDARDRGAPATPDTLPRWLADIEQRALAVRRCDQQLEVALTASRDQVGMELGRLDQVELRNAHYGSDDGARGRTIDLRR